MKVSSAVPVTYAPADKVRDDSYRCTSGLAREASDTWDKSSPERMSNLQGLEEHDNNIQMATVDQKVLYCQRQQNIIVLGIVLTDVNYGLYIGLCLHVRS